MGDLQTSYIMLLAIIVAPGTWMFASCDIKIPIPKETVLGLAHSGTPASGKGDWTPRPLCPFNRWEADGASIASLHHPGRANRV